jgi:alkylated DNA nucleotide flippase Atl1
VTLPPYADQVLELVETIPEGWVLSYSDVAELIGSGGPRQVGRVMSLWGDAVPWWRVVRADGSPAAGHEVRALSALRAEGVPLRRGGVAVDMTRGRWCPP